MGRGAVCAIWWSVWIIGCSPASQPERRLEPACDPVGCGGGREQDGCGKRCPDAKEAERAADAGERLAAEDRPPPDPPLPIPDPGPDGCVPPAAASAFTQALQVHADDSLRRAVEELGGSLVERAGFFLRDQLDGPRSETYTANGNRFAIVATMDSMANPQVVLAKKPKGTLHRVHPAARSHQLQIVVCGVNPCQYGIGARAQMLQVAIELQAGESMGELMRPAYDTWWVFPSYTLSRDCGPPPP